MPNHRDRHRDPPLAVRPPATLKADAQRALGEREMQAFVVACLTALVAAPERFLAQLDEHCPEKKPLGRPRRTPPYGEDSAAPARRP
ncbi:hypothetical protein [Streptomyces sp. NPDC047197]|uniref:hypothetical protein n=1 Tax=unclassified Streptomyces TaxID=2593676 RepID=UPI0033D3C067